MATITLDGVDYSTRKRTNKLRSEIAPLLAKKQAATIETVRLSTEVERLGSLAEKGELGADDPSLVAGYLAKLTSATEEAESIAPQIALKVLVDADGKPPTKALIDEHADLDELDRVVAVVLGTATENPTTAPPAGS